MNSINYSQERLRNADLKAILKAINEGTVADAEGRVTFTDHAFGEYFFLLADAFTFPSALTHDEGRSAVRRACITIRKTGNQISERSLLRAVREIVREVLSQEPATYTMWSKLRLRWPDQAPGFRIGVGDVTIEGRKRLPRWLVKDDYFISGIGEIRPNVLPAFGFLIARVESRSESAAAQRIFSAVETLQAVVNLRWRQISLWTERKPEAVLWDGPHHFFFRGRKFLCDNHIWYNGNFSEEHWNRFPKTESKFLERLPKFKESILALRDHPFSSTIDRTMTLMSEGMISHNLSFRLVRYWSALEYLFSDRPVGTTVNKRLIDRATFHYDDPCLAKAKLTKLSNLRNSYVHEGKSEGDDNDIIQYLRELMCQHIFYILHHGHDFRDHAEYLAMVDLPRDAADLAKKKLAIERRENILRSGRHATPPPIESTADGRPATVASSDSLRLQGLTVTVR